MNLNQDDLKRAADQKIITEKQAKALWDFFNQPALQPSSSFSQFDSGAVLHYLGAFVVLLSMGWLATIWQSQLGAFSVFWIGLLYGALFLWLGLRLWKHSLYRKGGGLLLTLSVCMVPLMLYGLEKGWGFWPLPLEENKAQEAHLQHMQLIHFYQATLGIATIIASACTLFFIRFPFLTAPLWLAIWLLSIDAFLLFFPRGSLAGQEFQMLSLGVGIVILILSFVIDRRTGRIEEDFAFWGYFFGLLISWIALTSLLPGTSEWIKAGYCFINIALLFVAVLLDRKIFLFFGALGIFGYLCYLAYDIFENSWLFPLALSLLGLGTLYLGILYQRHQVYLKQTLQRCLWKK